MKKKLPIRTQDFQQSVRSNSIIIDKTNYIEELTDGSNRYFFLSRPRRFGKSFLLSQIEYLFRGERELFKGLFIYDKWKWTKENILPVLHLDFSSMSHTGNKSAKDFFLENCNIIINNNMSVIDFLNSNNLCKDDTINIGSVVKTIYNITGKQTVVLIDEYDNPVMKNIENQPMLEKIRDDLKSIYAGIKSNDKYIRFFLLSGLSNIMKMSTIINLDDITNDKNYSGIIGFTENDVKLLGEYGKNKEYLLKIRILYNNYCFSTDGLNVYNPYDIIDFIKNKYRN